MIVNQHSLSLVFSLSSGSFNTINLLYVAQILPINMKLVHSRIYITVIIFQLLLKQQSK